MLTASAGRLLLTGSIGLLLALACGAPGPAPLGPAAAPDPRAASPSPTPAPTPRAPAGCTVTHVPGLCVGRAATASERAAMEAAGLAAAAADLGLRDGAACADGGGCLWTGDPPPAMVGDHAGVLYGELRSTSGGAAAGCWVYLYEDWGGGWHFDSARCAQASGSTPGPRARVWVSSCANVRAEPTTSAGVLDCLGEGTVVDVDSEPMYSDGYIWWHLAGRGWMAHDFLIAPKPAGQPFPPA